MKMQLVNLHYVAFFGRWFGRQARIDGAGNRCIAVSVQFFRDFAVNIRPTPFVGISALTSNEGAIRRTPL
jgi:hypothetical protein